MAFSSRPRYRWLVVSAATGVTFTFGVFFSFGVFLAPLISDFGLSSALTSFIFSVYSISYSFSVIMMGRLADRYGPRSTIGLGGLAVTLALVLSSRADSIWQLYLTFGVIGGIGAAALWIPPTKAVMEYFESDVNLNLAVGIVATGSGAGTLLISPMAAFFVAESGWRMSYLLFGLISALTSLLAVAVIRNPPTGRRPGSARGQDSTGQRLPEAMKTRNFWSLFGIYALGCGLARYTVMVYLVVYLVAVGFPFQVGAICLGLVGGGSVMGRISSGLLSRLLRENLILLVSFVLQGVTTIVLALSGNIWVLYSSAFIFGIGYGGYVPQFPVLTKEAFGMKSYGLVYGAISSGLGFGALIGPPVLGGLMFALTGNYFVTFILSGVFSLVAAAISLLIRFQTGPPRAEPPAPISPTGWTKSNQLSERAVCAHLPEHRFQTNAITSPRNAWMK